MISATSRVRFKMQKCVAMDGVQEKDENYVQLKMSQNRYQGQRDE